MATTGGVPLCGFVLDATIFFIEVDGFKVAMHSFLQLRAGIFYVLAQWYQCSMSIDFALTRNGNNSRGVASYSNNYARRLCSYAPAIPLLYCPFIADALP